MCLILFSYNTHPDYRLILAANRDEFYDRPTSALGFWDNAEHILAGRDLKSKGTWLGISKNSRIAAVTNYRSPMAIKENARSRGLLVSGCLAEKNLKSYLEHIKATGNHYSGFNLLAGNRTNLFWYSNMTTEIKEIKPGIYGLSNALLDKSWPKVEKGRAEFKKLIANKTRLNTEHIFRLLADRSVPRDHKLPDTGVGIEFERLLSSIFIKSKNYGTRSSSIILWKHTGAITFLERTFALNKQDQHITKKFAFTV
jgi:uncharacterized protein with NRDE domain